MIYQRIPYSSMKGQMKKVFIWIFWKKEEICLQGHLKYAWFGFVVQNQKASVSVRLQRPNKESWVIFLQLYSFLGFGLIKNGIDFGTQPSLFSPLWNLHVCAIIFRASGHFMKKNYSFSCLRICCENIELFVSVGYFLIRVLVLKKTRCNYFWRDVWYSRNTCCRVLKLVETFYW